MAPVRPMLTGRPKAVGSESRDLAAASYGRGGKLLRKHAFRSKALQAVTEIILTTREQVSVNAMELKAVKGDRGNANHVDGRVHKALQ